MSSNTSAGRTADHLVMARIGAPWGVKGWVKVFSFTQPPENVLDYKRYSFEEGGRLQTLEFDELKPHGAGFVGHIVGCDVREQCGRYTGKELLLTKQDLPALEEGYYWHQLEGLQVVNLAGEVLGRVDHLLETGANDVLVVHGDAESVDREERLLPYVSGQVVKRVDLDAGVIQVDWEKDY